MQSNGHPQPSPQEWARAPLQVNRHETDGTVAVEFRKTVTKGNHAFHESLWLTLEQLRAAARDHC